jgi:hypothetical protein
LTPQNVFGATIIECDTDGIILSHSQPEAVFKAVQALYLKALG